MIGGKWGDVQLGDPSELMSVANNQPENGFVCVFGILIFSSAIFLFDPPPRGGWKLPVPRSMFGLEGIQNGTVGPRKGDEANFERGNRSTPDVHALTPFL